MVAIRTTTRRECKQLNHHQDQDTPAETRATIPQSDGLVSSYPASQSRTSNRCPKTPAATSSFESPACDTRQDFLPPCLRTLLRLNQALTNSEQPESTSDAQHNKTSVHHHSPPGSTPLEPTRSCTSCHTRIISGRSLPSASYFFTTSQYIITSFLSSLLSSLRQPLMTAISSLYREPTHFCSVTMADDERAPSMPPWRTGGADLGHSGRRPGRDAPPGSSSSKLQQAHLLGARLLRDRNRTHPQTSQDHPYVQNGILRG